MTEERQRLFGLAIACQDAGQVALGVGVLRFEANRSSQGCLGRIRIAHTGMGHPEADVGICVVRIKFDAVLQGCEALLDPAEFGLQVRERREDFRRQQGFADEHVVFLLVGSGYARKGVPAALRALARLPAAARLAVVGRDNRPARYRRLAAAVLVDRVLAEVADA